MRKPYPIFCPTHLIAALLLASAGIASAAGIPKNAFDMPVLDSKGSPINYTRDELSGKVPAPLSTSLKAPASAPLQAASTGENLPEARATWVYPFLGNGLGRSLWAGPSDAGHPEIYASSTGSVYHANSFWAAFTYNSENGAYDIVFGSEAYASSIVAITVADVYGSSKNEIIVCLQDGTVRFYDQASKSLVKQFSVPASISAMHTADLDGTGKAEIIL